MNWYKFDNGNSIGKTGSEGGITIDDIENINGARISLEKDGVTAPYSVTLGIYGLMFHTHFSSTLDEAHSYFDFAKSKINEILKLYDILEVDRDSIWRNQLNTLIEELAEVANGG